VQKAEDARRDELELQFGFVNITKVLRAIATSNVVLSVIYTAELYRRVCE
jgi:hypothetical protein